MGFKEQQEQEWRALYATLSAILSGFGTENSFGEDDYWLVDDNYGSPQHKICVARISFITRPLVAEIQRALRQYALPWEVLFAFDPRDPRLDPADLGITVRKADIEECWDPKRLAQAFGPEFKWNPALALK